MNQQNQNELSFEELINLDQNFQFEDEKKDEIDLTLTTEDDDKGDPKPDPIVEEKKEDPKPDLSAIEDPKPAAPTATSSYSSILKYKLESGEWDDMVVDFGEGEKKLSEIEDMDEGTFKDLQKAIAEEKKKDFDSKYLEVDGLDDTKKKLINIIKNGDLDQVKDLFENPATLKEPFEGYDPDNDKHNEQVLRWFYISRGDSEEEAELLVKQAKQNLSLDNKAQQVVGAQRNAFKEKLEKREAELLKEKQQEVDNIKDFRKNLTSSLKEEGLTETLIRKFVDVATKKDSSGNLEIDTIYEETMKDPAKAKDLLYFMLDKENYLKKASTQARKETNLDTLKKINIISSTSKTKQKQEEEVDPSNKSIFDTVLFD